MAKTLGQALPLSGPLWGQWRQHLRRSAPLWLYVLVTLTRVICCRVSEVLALRACDFQWRRHRVRIKALKGGKEMLKWIISFSRASLQRLRDNGLVARRKCQAGARGQVTVREEWKWPRGDALLFESEGRPGKPRTKDVVSHAIVCARKTFQAERIDRSRIRPHSGRHRMIQDMKVSGVADHVGMAHARIKCVKTLYTLFFVSSWGTCGVFFLLWSCMTFRIAAS